MRLDSQSITLHLHPRQIVSLPQADVRNVSVSVDCGSVWITQDHDSADIVLEKGQSHRSRRRGAILIYGLSEAEVRIEDIALAAAGTAHA